MPRSGLLAALLLGVSALGCGHTVFAVHAAQATSDLEQAREMGAEQLAPYEYFYAKEHLRKAKSEAAEADYGDASRLAAKAKRYALRAIRVSKEARRGAVP